MKTEQQPEHYTISEVAAKMAVSYNTAKRMFEREPGVVRLNGLAPVTGHRRAYTLLRVPVAVYERVLKRSTAEPEPEGKRKGRK